MGIRNIALIKGKREFYAQSRDFSMIETNI